MTEKSPFSEFHHIGVIVRDMVEAIEYYQSLGMGPFEAVSQKVTWVERTIRGKPIPLDSLETKEYLGQMGSVQLQLLQPILGDYYWKKFLETKGEGVQHLGFIVDDIDKETAQLEEKGFEVLYRSRYEGGGGCTYFDTSKIGGTLMEIIQWPPKDRG